MATRKQDLQHELEWVKFLAPYLMPKFDMRLDQYIELARSGMFTVSSMFEVCLAHLGGYEVVREDPYDFSDGTEAKYATARFRNSRSTRSASLKGIENKTGLIRAAVMMPSDVPQFYFLAIPEDYYAGQSSIEIPFTITNNPQLLKPVWRYQVKDIQELANVPANGSVARRGTVDLSEMLVFGSEQ